MAAWDTNSAVASLRSLLGDGAADKFEFKSPAFPTADSVTTQFFVGQTRLVADTLQVYLNGVAVDPTETPDWAKGSFKYSLSGMAVSGEIEASFYYQWFTDAELE